MLVYIINHKFRYKANISGEEYHKLPAFVLILLHSGNCICLYVYLTKLK